MLFVQSAVCCFQYMRNEANDEEAQTNEMILIRRRKRIIRRRRMNERTNKNQQQKNIARDKSNRNVENNTQCSEVCLYEAKIESTILNVANIHYTHSELRKSAKPNQTEPNQTMPSHAMLCNAIAKAIVPTNRFYYYQLSFCSSLFILFIIFYWMRIHDVCPLCFTIVVGFSVVFSSSSSSFYFILIRLSALVALNSKEIHARQI